MIEIALYQPDIAPNAGTIARMCACLGLPMVIIEPAGFAWTDSAFRRAGMDYLALAKVRRASSWPVFRDENAGRRTVLLTTKSAVRHVDFQFRQSDVLLLGRESAGVPDAVHNSVECRITIPMVPPARSLNVAVAAAMAVSEALRQLSGFVQPVT